MLKLFIGLYVFSFGYSAAYLIGWVNGTGKRFLREHPHVDKKLFKTKNNFGAAFKFLLLTAIPAFNLYFCWWLYRNNEMVYEEMKKRMLEYYELKLEERLWV